jgi:hypothetical protein
MFRFEKKYILNNLHVEQLKHRLSPLMKLDPILSGREFYSIRSLYFDDYNDTCLKQVINGISERYKYRIRFYNGNTEYIVLEKKYKINNMTKKISCEITKEIVDNILKGNFSINKDNDKLLNEFYLMIKTRGFRPVVIIDYDRIPYVYDAGCVRITLDYNLSCSYDFDKLFSDKITRIPLMEEGNTILEVKYNDFIPDYIRFSLQLDGLYRTSYSKYGNGRLAIKNYVGGCL